MKNARAAPPEKLLTERPSYRWFVLALATAAQVGASFLVQALGALSPFLQSAFALDAAEVGLMMTAAQVSLIAGLLAAGLLLDRFSERLIVGVGASMVAAAVFAAARAQSYRELLGWLLVGSIGYCTIQPAGGKVVAAWFSPDTRGLAMGVRQAGLPLGAALGALVLPVIAERAGWRAAFEAGGLAALAGGLAFAFLYRQPPDATPARAQEDFIRWRERLAELGPRLPPIVWPGVTLVSVQFCITVYLPLDLRDRFGVPVETGVKLLFAAQFAGAVGRILLAAWSDRSARGRAFPLGVSMAACVAGVAAWLAAVAGGVRRGLARFLRLWLVRTLDRHGGGSRAEGTDRLHDRPRHGDQPDLRGRDAAGLRGLARRHGNLCHRLGKSWRSPLRRRWRRSADGRARPDRASAPFFLPTRLLRFMLPPAFIIFRGTNEKAGRPVLPASAWSLLQI